MKQTKAVIDDPSGEANKFEIYHKDRVLCTIQAHSLPLALPINKFRFFVLFATYV